MQNLKDNIRMEKRKDLENTFGQMVLLILGIGVKISYLDLVYIHGLMEGYRYNLYKKYLGQWANN